MLTNAEIYDMIKRRNIKNKLSRINVRNYRLIKIKIFFIHSLKAHLFLIKKIFKILKNI